MSHFDSEGRPYLWTPEAAALGDTLAHELGECMREQLEKAQREIERLQPAYANLKSQVYGELYAQLDSVRCDEPQRAAIRGLLQYIYIASEKLKTAAPDPLRAAVAKKIQTWERLGKCYDEFGKDANQYCNEYAEADDTAMLEIIKVYNGQPA